MMDHRRKFDALVLAGSRGPDDPLARYAGRVCKAVVPVAGQPMLGRVLGALRASDWIDSITVVGLPDEASAQPALASSLERSAARLQPGADSPAASVELALRAAGSEAPVLVTTADHALLRSEIVDAFLDRAIATGDDAVIGLAPYELVMQACPDTRRTVTRLQGGAFCGCNLFALLTPEGRRAVGFWRRLERHRKHPMHIAKTLGITTLLRFLCRRLTLERAMARLSDLSGVRVSAVLLPYGEAAIDVDKPDDLRVAENLLRR